VSANEPMRVPKTALDKKPAMNKMAIELVSNSYIWYSAYT